MNIGKLGEGVYLLTIGPSGRTIKPAKMAKAVRKPQQQESKTSAPAQTLQEELASMQAEALKMSPKDWWTASELAIELGVTTRKIYESSPALAKYISRPDGKHYLYYRDLLKDEQAVAMLKGIPQLPATRKSHEETQNIEPPVSEPFIQATKTALVPAEIGAEEIIPIKVERKVYCKELDRTFPSVTEGAKAIGARREALSKALRAGQRCRGYTFTYVDEEHKDGASKDKKQRPLPSNVREVYCKEVDRTFTSIREAASALGLEYSSLTTAMYRGSRCGGYTVSYCSGEGPNKISRRVYCQELGCVFDSISKAAKAVGLSATGLGKALEEGRPCKGFTFKFVDEQEGTEAHHTGARAVHCKELNKTFPSIHAAAKAVNRSVSTLAGAIEKNYLCGGYHFSYA